jgi:sugar phosphate isomerase/epimerase
MNWNSDDLPDLRPPIAIDRVLAEMVQAGYEGTEYGTGLPTDPHELTALLRRYGLALASNFCWISLEERGKHEGEIARALEVARTLAAMRVQELIRAAGSPGGSLWPAAFPRMGAGLTELSGWS